LIGRGVYSDKKGTVFQALCPHEPARAHKQHMHVCVCEVYECMCVFMLFAFTCSLQWWGYHTLIITTDSLQQWGSPISPEILHLLASFIFLQPLQFLRVHFNASPAHA